MKNWWYYHKWYVICGVILLGIVIRLTGNTLGWFTKKPDIQIAYIGESRLPEDTEAAVKELFSSLAGDYNRDGEVLVQMNPFITGNADNPDADSVFYRQAAMITLMADINDCESYFFLMEDPDAIQKEFQILAEPDGSCPDAMDYSIEGKVFSWNSCAPLAEADLGSYSTVLLGETTTGKNQEILSNLYLGRRCFYNERQTSCAKECSELWNTLTEGVMK